LYGDNLHDNRIKLILQKTRGGLIIPAPDVITVCRTTELLYKRAIHDIAEMNKFDFAQNLAASVFGRLVTHRLFSSLDNHNFDSEFNHTTQLIKSISLYYIRTFHETKKINKDMIGKNKRKVLSRLAIFQNV